MLLSEIQNLFWPALQNNYPQSEVAAIARFVLQEELQLSANAFANAADLQLNETEVDRLFAIIERLKTGEPVQYIVGHAYCCDVKLKVNAHVLIPRPETEELIYHIAKQSNGKALNIVDIGTGSGCIALGLKKMLPQCAVAGIDVSETALDVARHNAVTNRLQVNFHQVDILNFTRSKDFIDTYHRFDIIVSNPPYITNSEKEKLSPAVVNHEPHLALFVPDSDPLVFYRAIIAFSKSNLKKGGKIYLEINQQYPAEIKALLAQHDFSNIQVSKDISGNFRFAEGVMP